MSLFTQSKSNKSNMSEEFTRRVPQAQAKARDEEQPLRQRPEPDELSHLSKTADSKRPFNNGTISPTEKPLISNALRNFVQPYSNEPEKPTSHTHLLSEEAIWKGFSLHDRILYHMKLFLTCKQKETYVDYLKKITSKMPKEDLSVLTGKIFRLNIIETSQLEMDPYILHPFVKVHIVDMNSGKYLKKNGNKSVLSLEENITVIDGSRFSSGGIDFIPPFASDCADLRNTGKARPNWNHSVLLNEDAPYLFNENTVILFEILDFSKQLLREESPLLDHNSNYRIAWGYLRLHGLAKNYIGNSKIQLYRYKFSPNEASVKYLQASYKRIPFVYYDFIYPNKTQYEGYLTVQINGVDKPEAIRTEDPPKHLFEIESDNDDALFNNSRYKTGQKILTRSEIDSDSMNKKARELLRFRRFPDSDCRIPVEVLHRFNVGGLGCFRVAFSPNGKLLAAACTAENSKSVIRIYNVEEGALKCTIKAHKNIIHDLDWNGTSRFLISASSDFNLKVWRIPDFDEGEEIEEEDSERDTFCCTLQHSAYVYAAKCYRDYDESKLVIATGCFDGKVRVWRVNFEYQKYYKHELIVEEQLLGPDRNRMFNNLLEHRHPNCITIGNDGRLYVGDSLGVVHVWEIQLRFQKVDVVKVRGIDNQETAGDQINCIGLYPNDTKRLIVHSRDNCIRTIDYSNAFNTRVLGRFFGSKSTKFPIRSCVSPDGQYIASGSEDGKLYMWDTITSDPINMDHLQLSILGPVTDIAWNENYHMVATCGFGDGYPILVYVSKKGPEEEVTKIIDKLKEMEEGVKSPHLDGLRSPPLDSGQKLLPKVKLEPIKSPDEVRSIDVSPLRRGLDDAFSPPRTDSPLKKRNLD